MTLHLTLAPPKLIWNSPPALPVLDHMPVSGTLRVPTLTAAISLVSLNKYSRQGLIIVPWLLNQ